MTPLRPTGRVAASIVLLTAFGGPAWGQTPAAAGWVTAWSTSQQVMADSRVTNATVRMIVRVTVPGDAVRIRLDNAFGQEPVTIGRAFVGYRVRGPLLAAGSNHPLTFNGAPGAVVPPGGTVSSDPVKLTVLAQQDLAVSLYVPDANVRPNQHTNAVTTSYLSADDSGDLASVEDGEPFKLTTTSFWWLKAVDVQSPTPSGTIVAFGDSITDGTCTTLDAHDRWENLLSVRLGLARDAAARERDGARAGLKGVINEGIGGNTLTREGLAPPPDSTPGVERLDRDVLSHSGVTDVVLFMGTNDIRRGATAANLIAAMTSIARRVKARGIRIVGATAIPRHNVAPVGTNTGWNGEKTRIRNDVNQWIRTKAPFDGVIDFDEMVRQPAQTDLLRAEFNCGDGIHPSVRGYYEMGRSIDLALFERR